MVLWNDVRRRLMILTDGWWYRLHSGLLGTDSTKS